MDEGVERGGVVAGEVAARAGADGGAAPLVKVAVSHCLLGCACRYDGTAKPNAAVRELCALDGVQVVPLCPERASGLPVPRPPAEQVGERVVLATGEDVTEAFCAGAAAEAKRALDAGCDLAVLKAKSPSCGTGRIYDGTFSGALRDGWGVAARLLRDEGLRCHSEEDVEALGASAFLASALESARPAR